MESFTHIKDIFEQTPSMGVWITNVDGIIVWSNDKCSEITGYQKSELIGSNASIVKSGKHTQVEYENFWSTILSGFTWHGKFCNKRKDGTEFWAEVTVIPLKNEEGIVTNFASIGLDITQERVSKLKLNAILNNIPDLITIFTEKRICNDIYGNTELTKISNFDILDKNIENMPIGKDNIEKMNVQLDKTDQGINPNVDIYSIDFGTDKSVFECTCKRFNSNKYIMFWRDITEHKQALVLRKFVDNLDKLMVQNKQSLENINSITSGDFNGKIRGQQE